MQYDDNGTTATTAERIAAAINARATRHDATTDVRATVEDWAGGFVGLHVSTPYTTPDGRTSIELWVGSDDDGNILAQWGDASIGQYADEYIETHTTEAPEDDDATAAVVVALATRAPFGPWDDGLRKMYADAIEESHDATPAEVRSAVAELLRALDDFEAAGFADFHEETESPSDLLNPEAHAVGVATDALGAILSA